MKSMHTNVTLPASSWIYGATQNYFEPNHVKPLNGKFSLSTSEAALTPDNPEPSEKIDRFLARSPDFFHPLADKIGVDPFHELPVGTSPLANRLTDLLPPLEKAQRHFWDMTYFGGLGIICAIPLITETLNGGVNNVDGLLSVLALPAAAFFMTSAISAGKYAALNGAAQMARRFWTTAQDSDRTEVFRNDRKIFAQWILSVANDVAGKRMEIILKDRQTSGEAATKLQSLHDELLQYAAEVQNDTQYNKEHFNWILGRMQHLIESDQLR